MRSPFPGVDPYIEDQHYWQDFHATFLHCWREAILARLPAGYDARLEENVYLSSTVDEEWSGEHRPDIAVIASKGSRRGEDGGGVALAVEEEVAVATDTVRHVKQEPLTEVFIRIVHRQTQSLVTVIELLSPTNKSGDGRGQYLSKRQELRDSAVNLVELDLLVGGKRLTHARPLVAADHYAFVTRREATDVCQVYAWNVDQRLPTIPIPLLKPDPDLKSKLGEIYATAYERGGYERALHYDKPLSLPLGEKTLAWAKSQAATPVATKPPVETKTSS